MAMMQLLDKGQNFSDYKQVFFLAIMPGKHPTRVYADPWWTARCHQAARLHVGSGCWSIWAHHLSHYHEDDKEVRGAMLSPLRRPLTV
jgi:hypothetical protein